MQQTFKIPWFFGYAIILFFILLVFGTGSFFLNGIILQFCARIYVKDHSINKLSTALWTILVAMIGTMYLLLVIYLSMKAKNVLLLILIAYLLMFVFNLAVISFMYRINMIKAFILSIVFSIAQTVFSWIISFILWAIILLVFGVAFVAGPSLF